MGKVTELSWSSLALKTFILAVLSTLACANKSSQSSSLNPQSYRLVPILRGLEHPWSLAWLPVGVGAEASVPENRTMLIAERPGRLRIVRNGILDPEPIGGVPPVLASGQGGLMEVSVHPQFAKNRLVYLTYAHGTNTANHTRLARAVFDGKNLQNLQVILEVAPLKSDVQHFGSRITWLPDRTMLLAIGDGGNPPVSLDGQLIRHQAQNRRNHLGKILRLRDDGSIPVDNPFVKDPQINPAIWSYGHRNIQGLAFDPLKKRVWATEHGSKGGDELNLIWRGKNYGWPLATHSKEYGFLGGDISPDRSKVGMEDPKVVWTPALAPSGLALYTGKRFPQWRGNIFAGGLAGKRVERIELDSAGNVVKQEKIEVGVRVRDVRQGADEFLYILTDEPDGQIIRLEAGKKSSSN